MGDPKDKRAVPVMPLTKQRQTEMGFEFDEDVTVIVHKTLHAEISGYTAKPDCLWTVYHEGAILVSDDATDLTDAIDKATRYMHEHAGEWDVPEWAEAAVEE